MFKEKLEIVGKKINRSEVDLIINDDKILNVLEKFIEMGFNKITFIERCTDKGKVRWMISITISELDYERLIDEFRGSEIYTCEQDRFGRYFEKRLGA